MSTRVLRANCSSGTLAIYRQYGLGVLEYRDVVVAYHDDGERHGESRDAGEE